MHRDAESKGASSVAAAVEAPVAEADAHYTRQAYAGKLAPDAQLEWFRNTRWAFATRSVACSAKPHPLPKRHAQLRDLTIRAKLGDYDLVDYLSRNRVAGLLVLKRGEIALEHYDFGNDPATRWISMSMAKSISTTLIGAAIKDGFIGGVDEPLTNYLPELCGGAYDGVSIRHLLQMTSGVRWDDTHTDPRSERRKMLELQIGQQSGAVMRYVSGLPRIAPPGAVWNYSTGETHVVGALLRAAGGVWLSDYLSMKIWSRFGMQSPATWWLEAPGGLEIAGSGFSATLRDYARFGLFMLHDGVIGAERVLPEGWIAEATAPRWVGASRVDYGYMWWPVPAFDGTFEDRAYSARGIFGQYIYVNPRAQVVIVVLSARSKPKGAEAILDNDFFNSAVAAL